ncbi:MAG: hypothetical protein U1F43_21195 [Myxococcota bacterium]
MSRVSLARLLARIVACSAAATVGACGGDTTTSPGDSADSAAGDTTGDTCTGELCQPDTCAAGTSGCACDTGERCDDGLACTSGTCTPTSCVDGAEACPCRDGDVCDAGLACHDDHTCHACDADAVGCGCTLADGCSNDLVCADSDLGDPVVLTCRAELACADIACATHQLCDAGAAGVDAGCLAACDAGFTWNAGTSACDANPAAHCGTSTSDPDAIGDDCELAHKACVPGSGLTPAQCGDCLAGFLEDPDTNACRAPVTCSALGATCDAQHRLCIASTSSPAADATCGACVLPYDEDPAGDGGGGTCVFAASADCSADGDLSIAGICEPLHRECVKPDADPPEAPHCGDCAAPYFENPATGLCDLPATCADLGCEALGRGCVDDGFAACEDCKEGLGAIDPADPMSACVESLTCRNLDCGDGYCIESNETGVDATCATSSCGSGQALDQSTNACVTCSGSCTKSGQTGRFWLYTKTNGTCVCETIDDWYIDTTLGATPKPCDADGDGWVRTSAEPFVDPSGTLDPAIQANARCNVRTVDRVTLQNEWGQRYVVRLCATGAKPVAEGESCDAPLAVKLYEKTELDDNTSLTDLVKYPTYSVGSSGRQLRAEELNPLTKACVSASADLNGNAIEDLSESAEMTVPDGVTLSDTQAILLHFGYFIELHTSWYEDRPGEEYGTLVVAERSRCDATSAAATQGTGFFLGYDEANASDYWQDCSRNRRASFDRADPQPGYDFARWMCSATSGVCPMPDPPTTATVGTSAPDHGLCNVLLPPADGVWRGMTASSQFRCVEVVASAADADQAYELPVSELYDKTSAPSGSWTFNDCGVACPSGDDSCATDCSGDQCDASSDAVKAAANPWSPVLRCAPGMAAAGSVGFAARRYDDGTTSDSYVEGCIDEWNTWPQLCPGWITDLGDDQVQTTIGDGQASKFGELACGCGENYGGQSCDVGCPEVLIDPAYSLSPRSGWWMCGEVATTSMTSVDEELGPVFSGEDEDGSGLWVIDGQIELAPRERTPLCEDASDCNSGWMLR